MSETMIQMRNVQKELGNPFVKIYLLKGEAQEDSYCFAKYLTGKLIKANSITDITECVCTTDPWTVDGNGYDAIYPRIFRPGLIISIKNKKTGQSEDIFVPDITREQFDDALNNDTQKRGNLINISVIQRANRHDPTFTGYPVTGPFVRGPAVPIAHNKISTFYAELA